MKKDCLPEMAFEVSWEVCNKVGGIHTVIATKIPEMNSRLGEQYITIGPDIWREEHENPEFIEDTSLFKGWQEEARKQGLKIRTGKWNISDKPIAIIVDFTPLIQQKDEIFSKAWETWKLDSITGSWDYVEAALFGYASGMVIKSFTDYYRSPNTLAHFHEWMTGMGVLYLNDNAPYIGTVFTTHATVMGRSLAGNGFPLYDKLEEFNTDELSAQIGVRAKHSLEKLAAAKAGSFTTVSEITARECTKFLDKTPDVITPNGFNPGFVPAAGKLQENRIEYRTVLKNVASAVTGEKIDDDALLIASSGRYEFRNKGLDLFIKSLGLLNSDENLKRQIVAFIMVPANHYGPRQSIRERMIGNNTVMKGSMHLTHNLHDSQDDPVLNMLIENNLLNSDKDKVKVIFVPSYLNGNDGIINLPYYSALLAMDLTVFPSYYEPWGYTPLESMIFGVPTITTNLAGFGLWLKENFSDEEELPFYVLDRMDGAIPDLEGKLAEKMKKIAEVNEQDFNKLRQKTMDLANNATWSSFFNHYENAFCQALKKTGNVDIPEREKTYEELNSSLLLKQKTNEPVWKKLLIESKLPGQLLGLNELSRNLWWSWNYHAEELFRKIDSEIWAEVENNPIKLLQRVPYERLLSLIEDADYMSRYEMVLNDFKAYMALKNIDGSPQIAYFSMEYGFHSSLKIYSGGLGILAGDYLKEASDGKYNLFGVGLLYRHGYFRQQLTLSGEQISENRREEFSELPISPVLDKEGKWVSIQLAFPGRIVNARVWVAAVGRVDLYLLDTDYEANNPEDRSITNNLYGGDVEHRLKQEMILGVGGVRMIGKLGLRPNLFHCNEGHAAFIGLERLRRLVEVKLFKFDDSLEVVRSSTLFTTHTPVPAGHDSFHEDLIRTYMGHYPSRLNISWDEFIDLGRLNPGDRAEKFSMSYLASRLSQEINAVSKLHGDVTKQMFRGLWKGYFPEELHVGYVTNGVHYKTWTSPVWQKIHKDLFGEGFLDDQSNPDMWSKISNLNDREIWDIKEQHRKKLIKYLKVRLKKNSIRRHESPSHIMNVINGLDDSVLTIGFARRFATYKRATLLFRDLSRLSSIINKQGKEVQFLFAGKAHPNDKAGQDLIKHIVDISRRPEFVGKIIFLEDYDMTLARELVQGVDVWLNTPTRPLEASGTSGMKAVMNGVMNFSVLDGWWLEGYREGAGWSLPEERIYADQNFQDELDAATIYDLLENEIADLFYHRNSEGIPEGWVAHIKNTFSWIAPLFTTKRMIDDYSERFYSLLEARTSDIRVNNYHLARVLSRWKKKIASHWDNIKVLDIQYSDKIENPLRVGDTYKIKVKLDIDGLDAEDVGVELIISKQEGVDTKFTYRKEFTQTTSENNEITYKLNSIPTQPGAFKMGIRIFPKHSKLPNRQDFGYLKWI